MKKFTIEMENGGIMTGELYPEIAPITCANFEELANSGFYDGLIFHRVIPHFMIQGGDPEGTGMGGSPTKIPGEFASNGFKNDLKHTRGVLSMARSMMPNSASSQFFIMVEDSPHLTSTANMRLSEWFWKAWRRRTISCGRREIPEISRFRNRR